MSAPIALIERPRTICIAGGTGFVGQQIIFSLTRAGHTIRVLTRASSHGNDLKPLPSVEIAVGDVYNPDFLRRSVDGCDDVINLVGILNERGFGGGGFRRAHTELTRGVLQAVRSAGVARLLQVSALKAAVDAPSYYLRTKGEAEQLIRDANFTLDWTIFQPSVMFGPGDSFLNRFAGLLASIPFIFPLARPNTRFQPVFVDDVIEALLRSLQGGAGSRQSYELGGPQVYSLREIVALVGKLTGRRRWIMGLPDMVARTQALVMDFVPGRPFSSDNYRSLKIDSVCTQDGFAKLGLRPQSMLASARQYLGAFEDNARLSHNRASAGRNRPLRS